MLPGEESSTWLSAGRRFQLSKLGLLRCPRLVNKVGKIIRVRENSRTVDVQFDGNKQATKLHRDYIEPEAG
jgi:hypothetical protein